VAARFSDGELTVESLGCQVARTLAMLVAALSYALECRSEDADRGSPALSWSDGPHQPTGRSTLVDAHHRQYDILLSWTPQPFSSPFAVDAD
jgi:hypothetical protein